MSSGKENPLGRPESPGQELLGAFSVPLDQGKRIPGCWNPKIPFLMQRPNPTFCKSVFCVPCDLDPGVHRPVGSPVWLFQAIHTRMVSGSHAWNCRLQCSPHRSPSFAVTVRTTPLVCSNILCCCPGLLLFACFCF